MAPTAENKVEIQENKDGGKLKKLMTSTTLSQHLSKLRVHKSSKTEMADNNNIDVEANKQQKQQQQQQLAKAPVTPEEVKLPQYFQVKYLGKRDAKGLWGIKHTRKPVDDMVTAAR